MEQTWQEHEDSCARREDEFSRWLHSQHDLTAATLSENCGGLQESKDEEEKLKELLYYTPTVDVTNKEYVPVISMKSDKFKDNKAEYQFTVQKQQRGLLQCEKKPAVGMLIDKYLPTSFSEDVYTTTIAYIATMLNTTYSDSVAKKVTK
eukprot:15337346-Ditylum_brightwellii.AAC.1